MRTYLLLISLFFMLQNQSFGQHLVLPLWPDKIPNHQQSNLTEIRDTSDAIRISQVQSPDLAVFLPSKRNSTGQAVIICPGGGYRRLAYDKEGTDIAKLLNGKGIAALVLKYRLPDAASNVIPHQSPLLDAQRAMRLVRFHAANWNIDPQKIGIMGFSAGGHLASTLGTHFDSGNSEANDPVEQISCRPDFLILGYPVISFTQPCRHQGSVNALLGKDPKPELLNEYSNELQVKENTPPTFLFHASDDHAVPVKNSLLFYEALVEKNIPAEIHVYPKGGHGFSLAIGNDHLETWTDALFNWLKWMNQNKATK